MVVCLEQGADLHIAQLMPLPLTVTYFSKIQIGFTFLVPAYLGSPGKRAVKRVCVCVCVCVCHPVYNDRCAVDGGWSAWSEWKSCAVYSSEKSIANSYDECRCQTRSCDSPAPRHDGQTCRGNAVQVANCTRKHTTYTVSQKTRHQTLAHNFPEC